MLTACNAETSEMSQQELSAYYEGCNAAMDGADCNPSNVFEHPSADIAQAFRAGFSAQEDAMEAGNSIV